MDVYEATKVVFSRIQSLDPENASKIMGLLLIQDHSDKEMIRLAFGPENLLHSLVVKARQQLGISPNPSSSPKWGGSTFSNICQTSGNLISKSTLNPSSPPFYGGGGGGGGGGHHRRSCSVDDPNSGFGWMNGSGCRFVNGGMLSGSPSKLELMEECHGLIRSKSMQHHKLMPASASVSASFPHSMNKGLSLFAHHQLNDSPRANSLMIGEDIHKFSRSPHGLDNCRADSNHTSRQIYLTFPADSTFREEDVSSYFSIYGPVEDVRIPYQQKRMFGFVTFVFAETVRIILAKGNPHFVCDSRVLVKPYKEKGNVPDKFRKNQQQIEREEFLSCGSPTSIDFRDPFDLPPRARMMYDAKTRYMLWRRKLEEEADFQYALELQSQRLMGLQLLDVNRNHHHRSLLTGGHSIHSPTQSPNSIFHQSLVSSDRSSPDTSDEICASPPLSEAKQALQQVVNEVTDREREGTAGMEDSNNVNDKESPRRQYNIFDLPESLEHNLPDSPFASLEKALDEFITTFPSSTDGGGNCNAEVTSIPAATPAGNNSKMLSFLPSNPALDMASFQSCYFQMPRFSPGHGAIGM